MTFAKTIAVSLCVLAIVGGIAIGEDAPGQFNWGAEKVGDAKQATASSSEAK